MSNGQISALKTFLELSRSLIVLCLGIVFLLVFYIVRAPLIKKRRELENQLKLSMRKYETENLELDQINFYGLLETTNIFNNEKND
ncbi:unnamed protein product [Caenorhabditis angaria]|uniref:Uncharacterized protein n=1 Tax=Caenorhabditis angaria TaxID=860376 RepID=A0A9P1MSP5_9PELO|nr:unnamed protein product [Caenorhabditis angaria]